MHRMNLLRHVVFTIYLLLRSFDQTSFNIRHSLIPQSVDPKSEFFIHFYKYLFVLGNPSFDPIFLLDTASSLLSNFY
jgi:hypothetical protein